VTGMMISMRRFLTVIIAGLVFASAVHAEMVSVSQLDSGSPQSSHVCNRTNLKYASSSYPFTSPITVDLELWSVEFSSDVDTDAGYNPEKQHPQSFTEEPSSLSLCLSALMGLGLCASTHWVKRLHWSSVPEWFHDSGPFQIGHSHAATPESICLLPVYYFTQPVYTVENSLPQYCLRTVVSLWRKSQFTPAVIASRGPPNMS